MVAAVSLRRWHLLVATASLVLSAVICLGVAPSAQRGAVAAITSPLFPLKIGPTGRYLVDQSRQPFFWSGDTAWSLIAQGTNADIDFYTANRSVKGFNVTLASLIEHKFSTNAPRHIKR
jgi:hypothetical protein